MSNYYDEPYTSEPEYDYEEISYGKTAYKRVQRLRKRGKRRGIDVPYLNYELTKPEKPRIAFWIVAIISVIMFIGIFVGIGFFYNELIKICFELDGVGEFLKIVFKPEIFVATAGLSALSGLLVGMIYVLMFVLFLLPVIAVIYFYRFIRDAFYMAKCSEEEFAKGSIISSHILSLVMILVVATVIFIILMANITASSAKLYAGLIFSGIVIALGSLLVLIIIEKIRANRWFATLDEEKKQNYLAHERALRRVKSRLNTEKSFWNNLGK